MPLFNSKKETRTFVLLDIDSASVGAALLHIQDDSAPVIYYTLRQFIEVQEHEDSANAMLRTLDQVSNLLVSQGGPVLRREVGNGHIDKIYVSVGAPWQKTQIRTDTISETKVFTFTQALLSEIIKKDIEIPPEYIKSGETVLATLLNGYETPKPFGKKVTRADMIVLSSFINKKVAQTIEKTIRKTYHTHALELTAFPSVAYVGFKEIFPHEKDFLVFEVSGEETDIAFIKRGLLVDITNIPHGVNDLIRGARGNTNDSASQTPTVNMINSSRNELFGSQIEAVEKAWLANIETALQEASVRHALPHTLFLLADTEAREYLQRLLDSSSMRSLWFTDDPLRVISVIPSHFAQLVKTRGEAEGDVYLALLALFSKKGIY